MLVELPAEELYQVIQVIGNYVLTGEECNCDTVLSKIVCNQIVSVIDRKGLKYCNTTSNLKPRQKKQEEVQVKPPKPEHDDDYYFDAFLENPAKDFSTLITNVSFFCESNRSELHMLCKNLHNKYTADQIIQILQEKWLNKVNQ